MSSIDIQAPLKLLKNGQSAQAIPLLESHVRALPGHVAAHALLAKAYAEEGMWEEALSVWQQAAFLMPNSPSILHGLQLAIENMNSRVRANQNQGSEPQVPASPNIVVTSGSQPEPEEEIDRFKEQENPDPAGVSYTIESRQEDLVPKGDVIPSVADRDLQLAPDEELDDLISELETARIVPRLDQEVIENPALDSNIDDVASETLALIYAGQKQFEAAAGVYDQLALLNPEKTEHYASLASQMRERKTTSEN